MKDGLFTRLTSSALEKIYIDDKILIHMISVFCKELNNFEFFFF